jgi:adenine deaminase
MNLSVHSLKKQILAARREIPAELVLRKGRVINVFSGLIQETDVAVCNGIIVGMGSDYHGDEEIDLNGKWVVPGLIDGHIHIESSMLLPSRLAAALLPHGTTTIISDPHEIANVAGIEGVKLLLRDSESLPFDVFFMAPSCVPATSLETSGARLGASDLRTLKNESRVLGLAEMMDFPGVLAGNPDVLEKLVLMKDRIIDGHAPSLRGHNLQAYITAGMRSDHETSDRAEGEEKLNSGMMLMIREGTSAKNLKDLLSLVTPENSRRCCFVSDDIHPLDIFEKGHLDHVINKAMGLGLRTEIAVQMATLNPAEYFGLKDRGAVAPGYRADFLVLSDLEPFRIERVYKEGILAAENGRLLDFPYPEDTAPLEIGLMDIRPFTPKDLRLRFQEGKKARVIGLVPGQIHTKVFYEQVKSENGWVKTDTRSDILKLAVFERHRGTGHIGLGLVRGFGLKKGALASSVAHDSHNVIAVGVSDQDLWEAAEEVRHLGGGIAVTCNHRVLANVPLKVAGLMSLGPLESLVAQLREANKAASALGCALAEPFMSLSFLALPVIPELKLTDMGLVNVGTSSLVPLFVDDAEGQGSKSS